MVSFNGVPAANLKMDTGPEDYLGHPLPRELINADFGDKNKIVFKSTSWFTASTNPPIKLPVTPFTWKDVGCASGAPLLLGLVFVLVGVVSFVARPWQHASWALLMMCSSFAAFISLTFRLTDYSGLMDLLYTAVSSLFVLAPLYLGLAMVKWEP